MSSPISRRELLKMLAFFSAGAAASGQPPVFCLHLFPIRIAGPISSLSLRTPLLLQTYLYMDILVKQRQPWKNLQDGQRFIIPTIPEEALQRQAPPLY